MPHHGRRGQPAQPRIGRPFGWHRAPAGKRGNVRDRVRKDRRVPGRLRPDHVTFRVGYPRFPARNRSRDRVMEMLESSVSAVFSKGWDFGGKPRFFGMGLLSFGDGITRFLVFLVEIASLRPPVGDRAGCIGRIEGTIHPTEPPKAGGGPRSRNHGPLRNVPTAVPAWRWQRTPCRLAPAARVASDATAGADGCSPDHARSPHTGGSIRGDVRDVPARCRTSNSTGGRGRRTCTGRPDARTDSIRRADPQDIIRQSPPHEGIRTASHLKSGRNLPVAMAPLRQVSR